MNGESQHTPSNGESPTHSLARESALDIAPVLYVCGVNHERASLALRERFALGAERCAETLRRIRAEELGEEALVLSTCNRTEVYLFGPQPEVFAERLKDFFLSLASGPIEEHGPLPLYQYDGLEAVRHFFAVNSGLDSMILGENEIKAQVRQAFDLSLSSEMAGRNLRRLVDRAFRCSKRIRTETDLNTGTLGFGKAAAMQAEQTLGGIEGRVCVVIGAGKVGRAAAIAINEGKPSRLVIINRTPERAKEVAEGLNAEIVPITGMAPIMRDAEIIIGAAFAPNFLVTREMFERVRGTCSPDRKVCLIDTAVPRILDHEIRNVPGVSLFDLGDLEAVVAANRRKRMDAAQKAWQLVEEEVEKFHDKLQVSSLGPMIERLKNRFDEIYVEEQEGLRDCPENLLPRIQSSQRRLKQRLLHEAIAELKNVHIEGS